MTIFWQCMTIKHIFRFEFATKIVEFFLNNTNLTFLAILYKISLLFCVFAERQICWRKGYPIDKDYSLNFNIEMIDHFWTEQTTGYIKVLTGVIMEWILFDALVIISRQKPTNHLSKTECILSSLKHFKAKFYSSRMGLNRWIELCFKML